MSRTNSYSYRSDLDVWEGVLDEIEEYLEDCQDVRDGPDGPRPNRAMSLLSDFRWWRPKKAATSAFCPVSAEGCTETPVCVWPCKKLKPSTATGEQS
jgi:hypothetical protein